MPFRFHDELSSADVAFEAWGATQEELFIASAAALLRTMVEAPEEVARQVKLTFCLEDEDLDMLLWAFLQELIFFKDAERLLFCCYELDVEQGIPAWRMHVRASGEEIDPKKHELLADVKAVSFHNFSIERTAGGWRAAVVVDV